MTGQDPDDRERDTLGRLQELFAAEDELFATRRDDPEWQRRSERVRRLAGVLFDRGSAAHRDEDVG